MEFERQGADITASDMILPEDDPSEIVEFFNGSSVFLTGATGFLGKMMLEKLLRVCPDIKNIYILIRPKKGKEIYERFDEIFEGPNFDPLKRISTNYRQKVSLISGDCCKPDLGLNEEDKDILKNTVNCVIHCAATVRFDEKINVAANINVRSVRDIIKLAKQMKNLKAMLHISTAFSNCILKTIDEQFYKPPMTGDNLISLVNCLDEELLNKITPLILGSYPNTYVFTKAIAENIIKEEGKNLPIGVFRPSIVIASVKEPVAGWIDNVYGATGVLLGAALGVLRSLHGDPENLADMVPSDYVVNSALAAVWDVATMKSLNDNKETEDKQSREVQFEQEIPIYNFVSSPEQPITWHRFQELSLKHAPAVATEHILWLECFSLRKNYYYHLIASFFLHTIPAYIIDFLCMCIGKKPQMVQGYKKITKFSGVIGYFSSRQWEFGNQNTQALWNRMKKIDQGLFEFSMKLVDWDQYFYTYVRGARVYILKDPLETVPKGRKWLNKIRVAHYTLVAVLTLLFYKFCMFILSFIF